MGAGCLLREVVFSVDTLFHTGTVWHAAVTLNPLADQPLDHRSVASLSKGFRVTVSMSNACTCFSVVKGKCQRYLNLSFSIELDCVQAPARDNRNNHILMVPTTRGARYRFRWLCSRGCYRAGCTSVVLLRVMC